MPASRLRPQHRPDPPLRRRPRRIISLVPSITETVTALGCEARLVGVTDWCVRGAPSQAARVGGTKYPDLAAVRALNPDLVLANAEENRREDVEALRADGVSVLVTFPQTVSEAAEAVIAVGSACGASEQRAAKLAAELRAACGRASARAPTPAVPALTLVWRRPWMALGAPTYADDLLVRCGFRNVVADLEGRYPQVEAASLAGRAPAAVLLPSEPYRFDADDLPAVAELVGAPCRFVDGELLTWHGPRIPEALETFGALARELTG